MILVFPVFLLLAILIMAWGVSLIMRGAKGRVNLSAPHCRNCQYDLRWINPESQASCPECGSDLSKPRAVNFGRFGHSKVMIAAGIGILLLPILFVIGMNLIRVSMARPPGGGATVQIANKPTTELIADLSTTAGDPWTWQELEQRYIQGQLTAEHIGDAIDHLSAYLQTQPNNQPLHWADSFVKLAIDGDYLTEEQLDNLIHSYYKRALSVTMRSRLRQTSSSHFTINTYTPWNLPGLTSIASLRSVSLDGDGIVEVRGQQRPHASAIGPMSLGGQLTIHAEPGSYTLEFVVDVGVLDERLAAFEPSNQPGPADTWPATRSQWTKTIEHRIEVLPEDQSPIELITGRSELADDIRNVVHIRHLHVERNEDSTTARLLYTVDNQPPMAVSFDVFIRYEDQNVRIAYFAASENNRSLSTVRSSRQWQNLPDGLESVTVYLQPNARQIEDHISVDAIWGEPLIFEHVPVVWHTPE